MSDSLVPSLHANRLSEANFFWNAEREHAACLLAMGYQFAEVGRQVNIHPNTVKRWYNCLPFRERVVELRTAARQALFNIAIADKQQRVEILGAVQQRILQVIQARAEAPEMQNVPGGNTGLLTVELKSIGTGAHAQVVEEYKYDKAVVDSLLHVQKQAAQELGQWNDQTTLNVNQKAYIGFDTEEV